MPESISQYYKKIEHSDPEPDADYSKGKPYFNIFSRQCNFGTVQFSYRDFYKVTLIIGTGRLYYADKWILVDRPALLFSNPLVPYAWESISEEQKGLFCIFNEQFVQTEEKNSFLTNTPLFKVSGDKVFFLNDEQVSKVLDIYTQMQAEINSDYIGKLDVLRSYLHLLIHTAMKMQYANHYVPMTKEMIRLLKPLKKIVNSTFFVLTNKAKPTEPRTYRNYYKQLMKDLGMPDLKFHGLRHSFATRCIESNCDYKTVSVLLGHSNISTTLNLYVHPNMEQKKKCIDQMFKALR